ncbi:MAG: glycerate kinase type-2 family protein [Desulfomonilia bacterium]
MNLAKDLEEIFLTALERVDPYKMIVENISIRGNSLVIQEEGKIAEEDLGHYSRIIVLGIGKASAKMGMAMEDIFGDKISEGMVITKYGHGENLSRIHVTEAAHPIPDKNSVGGAQILYQIASEANENTLIINLVSGGGSALFTLPQKGISLEDIQSLTRILLESGADIKEINCLRKHISQVKGGHFARISYPARMINIILSDVVGDRLDTIASGITVPDDTTFAQAQSILKKYRIEEKIPPSISDLISRGIAGSVADTPKQGDPVFSKVSNILLGNNLAACRAARSHAQGLGYNPYILTSSLTGEAREIARFFTALARDVDQEMCDFTKPALLIAGGETTVTIRGTGKGGRNQEMVLAFLIDMLENYPSCENIAFLSGGTDGNDGPTDAAGAYMTADLVYKVEDLGLSVQEFLDNNDSYHLFEKTGNLLMTGPTNTNVCDIQLLAVV